MAPVVLESPAVNMHNSALSPMSRVQFNGHIRTPPASDHSRNDDDASPLITPAPLPPAQARNTASPFPLDPALKERIGDNGDPVADQNNPSAISELACTNCGTVTTPQWRRGDDGKSICNACGLYYRTKHVPRPLSLGRTSTLQSATHPNAKQSVQPSPFQSQAQAQAPSQDRRTSSPPTMPTPAASPALHQTKNQSAEASRAAQKHPGGTCPGDGRCDGTGGTSACNGCPTYNNAIQAGAIEPTNGQPPVQKADPVPAGPEQGGAETSGAESSPVISSQTPGGGNNRSRVRSQVGALSCANCGTSTTPLWRRDDVGNNICNACGPAVELSPEAVGVGANMLHFPGVMALDALNLLSESLVVLELPLTRCTPSTFPPAWHTAGLYFKLHGTHRPNSMKKTVIKRRKRVPAAAGAPSSPTPQDRMTDQAAAEVLASVGRALPSGSAGAQTESEEEQPKKRARRPRTSKARDKDAEGTEMDEDEDEGKPRKARRTTGGRAARASREGSNVAQAGQWGETMMQGMGEPSGSQHLQQELDRYGPGAPRGNPFPPHASQTLPGLIATLGPEVLTSLMNTQYVGVPPPPPSSYIRSGSAQGGMGGPGVPSRAHSPVAQHSMNAPHPPEHLIEGVPTLADLDHHYRALAEERKRLEEMLERTDRMMAGVKRGMDEMRAAGAEDGSQPSGSQQPSQGEGSSVSASAPAVPLASREKGNKEGATVWHVSSPASQPAGARE
ncbi:transcription factor [Ganoderma sinense ZZ0214-1]|uniref:Transcription factor n=1 Tax=Ganoderma sinense ZZ0214-1 TaxID=1077348 RepID=A0A2G8RTR3_9APHY|nr:transcription factor [Ganoderma sinense ZZ0214-1]